jgi:hypothetical protein
MRAISSLALLLLSCACMRAAHSQTFDHPLIFGQNPYASFANSCAAPVQYFFMPEIGYAFNAPTVVYRVFNLAIFPHPTAFKPRHITLSPQSVDLSIWVCSTHQGYNLTNCIDGSDNGWNAVNQVTIPAQAGGWYVVISGNIDGNYPNCGNYVLNEYY